MSYRTNRIQSPAKAPHLFRRAKLSDITNSNVRGFYNVYGEYWRKNGQARDWKPEMDRVTVPVRFGLHRFGTISDRNVHYYYVRLDEVRENTREELSKRIKGHLSEIIGEVESEHTRGA